MAPREIRLPEVNPKKVVESRIYGAGVSNNAQGASAALPG
jgi:hypothetical protein